MLKLDKPFLIAEIGINHNGNFSEAIKLINKAKLAGADAVKFQTYITEKRVKKNSPIYDILKRCELTYDEFYKLKKYCDQKKILFFSTPFDIEAVNFLKDIKVKLFKLASFDISNYNLIREIIKTKKKTIVSTGMASLKEILTINKMFKKKNIPHYFLHCVSAYPNKEEHSYLNNLNYLTKKLNCQVGLSDHTNNINVCKYAYFMGSRIFEKHFKLSINHKCVDSAVSITPEQFLNLKKKLMHYEKILGKIQFGVKPSEKKIKIFKRFSK